MGDIFNRYKRLLWGFDSDISHVQLEAGWTALLSRPLFRDAPRDPELVTTGSRRSENAERLADFGERTALGLSVGAMSRAIARVSETADPSGAFAAIGEAVWWVTITDDTLRTRHRHAYQAAQAALDRISPPLVSCLAGLRSVRNRIGHEVDLVDFVNLEDVRPDQFGDDGLQPGPGSTCRNQPGRTEREQENHRHYLAALAGRNVIEGFGIAETFITSAHHGVRYVHG